jgi:hypothetical protein
MTDLEKIKNIVEAHEADPKKCPYCFRKLKSKFFKADSSARYYCSFCEQIIDLEFDYMHAIAIRAEKYLVLSDPAG